jgi:RNA polymerase sigma factor (sigma-70 family)
MREFDQKPYADDSVEPLALSPSGPGNQNEQAYRNNLQADTASGIVVAGVNTAIQAVRATPPERQEEIPSKLPVAVAGDGEWAADTEEIAAADLYDALNEAPDDGEMELPDFDDQTRDAATRDSLQIYQNQLGRFPVLDDKEKVAELCNRVEVGVLAADKLATDSTLSLEMRRELNILVEDGARAKADLITGNLRLVYSFAKKKAHVSKVPILDLIQEGNLGLIHAIEKFDYTKGYALSTFAAWTIRERLQRAFSEQGSVVTTPTHSEQDLKHIRAVRRSFYEENNAWPSDEYVAMQTHFSEERVTALRRTEGIDSLFRPIGYEADGYDDTHELGEMLLDPDQPDMADMISLANRDEEFRSKLFEFIRKQEDPREILFVLLEKGILFDDPRLAELLWQRFGLERDKYPYVAIGKIVGLDRTKVGKLAAQGKEKLVAAADELFDEELLGEIKRAEKKPVSTRKKRHKPEANAKNSHAKI